MSTSEAADVGARGDVSPAAQPARPRRIAALFQEMSGPERLVWAAIVLTSLVRVWFIARSFFWQDDYIHIWKAWNFPAEDMVLQPWQGHFEPASMAVFYLMTRVAPQNWLPAAAYLAVLATAIPVLWWLMLRSLAGVNAFSSTATLLLCCWPGLLVPETWLAAGLEITWVLFALGCVWSGTRARGRWRYLPLVLMPVGALFNERALYALPLLIAALLLFHEDRSLIVRCRSVWAEYRRLLAFLTAEVCVMLVTLLALSRGSPGVERGYEFTGFGGIVTILPAGVGKSLMGLEWFWPAARTTLPNEPPWVVQAAVLLVIAVLVVLAWRRSRTQTLVAVAAVLVMTLLDGAPALILRGDFLGSALLRDPRFTIPTGLVILLALASFGTVPRRGAAAERRVWGRAIPAVAVLAVAGSGLYGLVQVGRNADGEAARQWLASARAAFVGPDKPALVSTRSPAFMLNEFFFAVNSDGYGYEQGTTRTLLAVGPQQPRFATATVIPVGLTDTGKPALIMMKQPPLSSTDPGYGANCSRQLSGDRSLDVPMPEAGMGNPAFAVDYLASGDASVTVDVDGWEASSSLIEGLHTLWFFPPPGHYAGFSLRQLSGEATVCIGYAQAHRPEVLQ